MSEFKVGDYVLIDPNTYPYKGNFPETGDNYSLFCDLDKNGLSLYQIYIIIGDLIGIMEINDNWGGCIDKSHLEQPTEEEIKAGRRL